MKQKWRLQRSRPRFVKHLVNSMLDAAQTNQHGNLQNVSLVGCHYNVANIAPLARRLAQLSLSWSKRSDDLLDPGHRRTLLRSLSNKDGLDALNLCDASNKWSKRAWDLVGTFCTESGDSATYNSELRAVEFRVARSELVLPPRRRIRMRRA